MRGHVWLKSLRSALPPSCFSPAYGLCVSHCCFLVSLFPTKLQCADTCELGYDPARSTAIYPRWTGHSPTAMFSSTVPIRQWLRRNLCDMVTILLYLSLHRIAHSCRDRRIVTSWRGLPKTLVKFYAPIHLSCTRLRTVN